MKGFNILNLGINPTQEKHNLSRRPDGEISTNHSCINGSDCTHTVNSGICENQNICLRP